MRKILVVLVAVIVVGGLSRSCSECVASDDTGALSPTVREKYNRELYQATLARDVASVGSLLEKGADPNAPVDGMTPLAIACFLEQDDRSHKIMEMLMDAGADPNQFSQSMLDYGAPYRVTPLMVLAECSYGDNLKSAKMLIERGADVNIANECCATAGSISLKMGNDLAYYLIVGLNAKVPRDVKKSLLVREKEVLDTVKPTLATVGILLNQFYPLDSEEYRRKIAIVNKLEKQGIDYWACKNPDSLKKYVNSVTLDNVKARQNPPDWEQYLKDY